MRPGDYIKYNNEIYKVITISYVRSSPRGVSARSLLHPNYTRNIDYFDLKHACEVIDPNDDAIKAMEVLYGPKD